ncbi:AEC family transporter [Arhodomonas sp. SL1]|uniref:AEC family transporter n=1 Tax=Arhodomonas sp. SL1 TaxID=3425691 RepID=UPI003F881A24
MLSTSLQAVVAALVPIFALIALGHGLRRTGFPARGFWPELERLVYYLLFPALLVETLATANVDAGRVMPVAAAVVTTLAGMSLGLLALRRLLPLDGPGFTSVFQGGIRFNTYLGVATALALYGPAGAAVAALVMALLIPLVNVISVAVLLRYADGRGSLTATLRGIARNPLILACVLGIALNRTGIGLPAGSDAVLEIVGRAALPLGLMTVGAGLQPRTAVGNTMVIAITTAAKLAVMPLLAWMAATAFGLGGLETRVLILFAALPTASSAFILARQMGGDHALMATLLTAQTLVSVVSLPLIVLLSGPPG